LPTTDTQTVQPTSKRLIVFDVEGVLIPKRRYLLFEASRRISIPNFIKMLWAGLLYETASKLVSEKLPDYSVEQVKEGLRRLWNQYSEWESRLLMMPVVKS
jgi:phosphoserine phosphatase